MIRYAAVAVALSGLLAPAPAVHAQNGPSRKPPHRPNILFVIMDDVGIDQVAHLFGYDTEIVQPDTPTIDQLAGAGVNFRNAWSMPACSTSRAAFFTGRYPFRTGVLGALGQNDLANSMVSVYETTTPKLLKQAGYESALFGKFHLTLPDHDPAGAAAPIALGWDYFAGWVDRTGDPSSIDRTAGGVIDTDADPPAYSASCGFIPSAAAGGADAGACYRPNAPCLDLVLEHGVPPGRACRDRGGILVPDESCRENPPALEWNTLNSHFVSPVAFVSRTRVNEPDVSDPRARTYRANFAVDEAVSWINRQPHARPWMATVSFATDHTPLVQPPADETPTQTDEDQLVISDLDCSDLADQRVISDLMITSLDGQVARLLVETGLATRNDDGSLNYDPAATDTMVVLLGDNGSLGTTVKLPFDDARAKGSPYQTGVWVPLIITGPLVNSPSRVVTEMVNIVDLFSLFGEFAGITDIHRRVAPRRLDAEPMLPYLASDTSPSPPIRRSNFTQVGVNLQQGNAINPPCTIASACTQIPVSASVCADNDGTWWGSDHRDDDLSAGIPAGGFTSCCQVNAYVTDNNLRDDRFTIDPPDAVAIRDASYKLVRNTFIPDVADGEPFEACASTPTEQFEFYLIDEMAPFPLLDKDSVDGHPLDIDDLDPVAQASYDFLLERLTILEASQPECPGDGNGDLFVDRKDLRDYQAIVRGGGQSSHYDFNVDGVTDDADKAIIETNLRTDCRPVP